MWICHGGVEVVMMGGNTFSFFCGRIDRLERMRRQGKAPPKKGQGKRASKRK